MFDEWRATAAGGDTAQSVTVPGKPTTFAGADAVEYTSSIPDPRDADDEIAILELRGLYADTAVELGADRVDGEGTVEHDTYFRPLRVPFEPDGETDISVTCRAPTDRFGGIYDTELVPDEQSVPGIWWGAEVETRSLPCVDSIDVSPVIDDDGVQLDLRTTVLTDGPLDGHITYSIRPAGDTNSRGMMQRGSIQTDSAGKTVAKHTVDVHDPELWWPRGLGEQHQYTLRAKLGDSEHECTTGICDITFDDGRLVVNGTPLSIRGVNVLGDDEADIDRALDCNANLVRAHAHVPSEQFYERCRSAGLLVWQDLPLTGPGPFETDAGVRQARALDRQYSRYPCLAATTVHDDPVDAFSRGLGTGRLDRLRFRFRAWRSSYGSGPAEEVAAALPDHRPSFPTVAAPGVGSEIGSYYPGWSYGEVGDIDDLLDRYPASVLAEFGAGALADDDPGDVPGFDAAKHGRHVDGGVEQSQAYQAQLVSRLVEYLRCERRGTIAFALRDTAAAGMGVYSADGEPKAAVDALSQAFEPVQAFLTTPDEPESTVTVINDTPRAFSGTVTWETDAGDGRTELTVGASGRWTGGSVDTEQASQVTLELSYDDGQVTNSYDLAVWS
jgi:hypothetical protein